MKSSFSDVVFYTHLQRGNEEILIAQDTVLALLRGGPHHPPLRTQEDIEACENLVTDWFREQDNLWPLHANLILFIHEGFVKIVKIVKIIKTPFVFCLVGTLPTSYAHELVEPLVIMCTK